MTPRQLLAPAVLYAIVVAASATCGGDMPNQPNPGNSRTVSITVTDPNLGEVERSFVIHLPAGYSPSGANDVRTPLVLDFHGWGGDGSSQQFREGSMGLIFSGPPNLNCKVKQFLFKVKITKLSQSPIFCRQGRSGRCSRRGPRGRLYCRPRRRLRRPVIIRRLGKLELLQD